MGSLDSVGGRGVVSVGSVALMTMGLSREPLGAEADSGGG